MHTIHTSSPLLFLQKTKEQFPIHHHLRDKTGRVQVFSLFTGFAPIFTGERAPVPTADTLCSARLYYVLAVNIHHQGPHAFFKASKTPLSVASCTSTTFSLDFEPEPMDTSLFFTPSTCAHVHLHKVFTISYGINKMKHIKDRLHLCYYIIMPNQ